MNKRKAIYYTRLKYEVPGFYDNATNKIVAAYATKYGIDPAKVAKIVNNNNNIPLSIAAAEAAKQTAQAKVRATDELLAQAKIDLMDIFTDINEHPDLVETDAEDLGMRVFHEPVNWNTITPKIKRYQVTDNAVEFYYEIGPSDGIIMYEALLLNPPINTVTTGIQTISKDDIAGLHIGIFTEVMRANHSPIRDTRRNRSSALELRIYMFKSLHNDIAVGMPSPYYKVVVDFIDR
ncbi:MAG: hypothetical protein KA792_01490 [Bacteroidales bacterium]|nr:hypothetical protein [Bacteroidales bacterium]